MIRVFLIAFGVAFVIALAALDAYPEARPETFLAMGVFVLVPVVAWLVSRKKK
jgi:hypothetical protein